MCGSITTGNSASSTPQYNEPSSNIQNSPFNENPLFSSPSLPNISKHPSRFYPSTTSPTLFHHQKLKKHFRERLSREVVNANALGSIVSNQSFINNDHYSFLKQKQVGSLLLSNNSVDNNINQNRDSPPSSSVVQNLRNKTEQIYNPYCVSFKPLSKKLSRTHSAPLPFGIQLQNSLALAQQLNAANNSPIATNQTTSSPSATTAQSMDTNQVKQKVKQSILTKQHQQQQKLISKKPSSLDEQSSDKQNTNDKNVDSGSGSFDENYNFSELSNKADQELAFAALQRQLLEKIQNIPNINQLATSTSLDPANLLNSSQLFANQQQPTSEDINAYQCLLAHHVLMQQQSAMQSATQFNNQLNNNLSQLLQSPDNYAKLLINNHLQQQTANALKRADRALSSPIFNPSAAAYLAGQPSLTSLVGPFSGLNLSQTNLNTIANLNSTNSTLKDPNLSDVSNENRTAIVTDESCLAHDCTCGNPRNHLESSERLIEIIKRLYSTQLMSQCIQLPARKATIEELETVHSPTYCQFFATEPAVRQKLESSIQLNELPIKSYVRMGCGGVGIDNDTIWNEFNTWQAGNKIK